MPGMELSYIVIEKMPYLSLSIETVFYALSFYVTKAVLVGPKWFWSDQIDMDLTIMIWSQPK